MEVLPLAGSSEHRQKNPKSKKKAVPWDSFSKISKSVFVFDTVSFVELLNSTGCIDQFLLTRKERVAS